MSMDFTGIPVLAKRKDVRFTIKGDPSGGVRVCWNEDEILLSPDEGMRLLESIAKSLGFDVKQLAA